MGGDVLGWRKKFAVLGPSTNTIVQPDFDDLRPAGVTNHYSRIFTPNTQAVCRRGLHPAGRDDVGGAAARWGGPRDANAVASAALAAAAHPADAAAPKSRLRVADAA